MRYLKIHGFSFWINFESRIFYTRIKEFGFHVFLLHFLLLVGNIIMFIFFIPLISIGFGVHDVLRSCISQRKRTKRKGTFARCFSSFLTKKIGKKSLNFLQGFRNF